MPEVEVKVIRLRTEDFSELMEMMVRSYRAINPDHPRFEVLIPDLYRPDEDAMKWCFGIKVDGKIVSTTTGVPIDVNVLGKVIQIGGVSGVATLPEYRGRGYMQTILDRVVRFHREECGFPFGWLAGDRRRYSLWGYERVAGKYRFTISNRAPEYKKYLEISDKEIKEGNVDEFDWNVIWEQAKRNPQLSACGKEMLKLKYKRLDHKLWIIEGKEDTHTLVRKDNEGNYFIMGYAGIPEVIGYIITKKISQGANTVFADLPIYPNEYCGVFKELMWEYSIVPSGNIAVFDVEKTFNVFKPHFDTRVKTLGLKGKININIGDARSIPEESVTIEADGSELNVSKRGKAEDGLNLTRLQISEIMFSPLCIGWSYRLEDKDKWFASLFPVPFYFPPVYGV